MLRGFVEESHLVKKLQKFVDMFTGHRVGEHERFSRSHKLGVVLHDIETGTHIGSEVGLVDHEDIALTDAGTILARYLVAGGNIDDIDEEVHEGRTECKREVVAATLYEHYVGIGEFGFHLLDGGYVHRRILAYRSMRAGSRLHAYDAVFGKITLKRLANMFGILRGYYVIGYDQYLVALFQQAGRQRLYKCCLLYKSDAADETHQV